MSREQVVDEKLKDYVRQENARRLFVASQRITRNEESQAKTYLMKQRKIPISSIEMSSVRSLEDKIEILEFNEKTGTITSRIKEFNCMITPVLGYDGDLIGVQALHLIDGKKKKPRQITTVKNILESHAKEV